ncbi:carbohydrate kinase family protein [Marinigracilibium pacificum]|uniref:Carbohydrate kinase n=1 Tax=Marinigracilibium pacificum TaxID=2729599 RepID=A0A848J2H5_9BACT|nr:carbohydrate kinase [Marinigracilibium pacificum]NMM49528.1 carbohydrate kinase [Marinigracilibium pacificum]
MTELVVCFGEVLWDMLPTGTNPGGAPMNVAIHLRQQGVSSAIISKVGDDKLGRNIVDYIKDTGVLIEFIQYDRKYPTGTVKADISNPENVKYLINEPVAWDFIEYYDEFAQEVFLSKYFVFGSLASRNPVSYVTLTRLLDSQAYKIFDVNLRSPYFFCDTIETLLNQADMVKMNDEELIEIGSWFFDITTKRDLIRKFIKKFNFKTMVVTRGARGAILYEEGQIYEHSGFKVIVADTIGSGDSFLATYLAKTIEGKSPMEKLKYACAVGAIVASKEGATPKISQAEIEQLISEKP